MKEVFTLTGFDSNMEVEIRVEFRFGGDPASYDSDEAADVEDQSRQIASEFLLLVTDRVPIDGQ